MKDLTIIYKELGDDEATRRVQRTIPQTHDFQAKSAIKNLSMKMKENLCSKLHTAQKQRDITGMRIAVEKFATIFPDKDKKLWVPLQHYLQGLDIPALDKSAQTCMFLISHYLSYRCSNHISKRSNEYNIAQSWSQPGTKRYSSRQLPTTKRILRRHVTGTFAVKKELIVAFVDFKGATRDYRRRLCGVQSDGLGDAYH